MNMSCDNSYVKNARLDKEKEAAGAASTTNKCSRLKLLRALVDPGADQCDLLFGQGIAFAFRGHVFVFVQEVGDAVDEPALLAFADGEDVAVFTAFFGGGDTVEAEFGFLFFRTVTFEARFFEDRLDVFVVGDVGLGRRGGKFFNVGISRVGGDCRREGEAQQD
jgi:hypothetical protein